MKSFVFLLAVCISLNSFSQKGDYLVTTAGDTAWGSISLKNKEFLVNGNKQLVFNADEVLKVKSSDFKGQTVLHCKLETYTDNLNELSIDWIENGIIDTVMVLDEIYSTKKINLYYATSKLKTPYYFYKTPSDNKPVQLVVRYFFQGGLANYTRDRAKYRGEKSSLNLAEIKGYVNQLRAIMGDCKKISEPMWDLLSYRNYSLKKLIKKYEKCN